MAHGQTFGEDPNQLTIEFVDTGSQMRQIGRHVGNGSRAERRTPFDCRTAGPSICGVGLNQALDVLGENVHFEIHA